MFWMRMPRSPTHEPTASTPSCLAWTATLLRDPGSLAMPTISTAPLYISGTSISKSRLTRSLSARETIISGPLADSRTVLRSTLILEPTLQRSYGACSDEGRIASALPSSTMICLGSIRCTVTVKTSPSLSANSRNTRSRSASRNRWMTTCLAVCAAMRPALWGNSPVGTKSPISASARIFLASARLIWMSGSSISSATVLTVNTLTSPVLGSSLTEMSCPAATLSRL